MDIVNGTNGQLHETLLASSRVDSCLLLLGDLTASFSLLVTVMSPNSSNEDDGFFNDLSRQPHSGSRGTDSPPEQSLGASKTKRIACVICRKRKLKCDGNKPKCATCERLGHNCAYDEVRRKSGPKRGYVKDLEARLGLCSDLVGG